LKMHRRTLGIAPLMRRQTPKRVKVTFSKTPFAAAAP